MSIHSAGVIAVELVLVPACLSAVFLLLLFGLVIAPAVFAKAERAERARRILSDLLPWVPLFALLVRFGGKNHRGLDHIRRAAKKGSTDSPKEGSPEPD